MEKIIEFIKLCPKYLFVISVASGILLFANNKFINILGIGNLLNDYRKYLGIVFLISSIFTINEILCFIIKKINKKYSRFISKKLSIKRLHNLTDEEKKILREYIYNQTRTCNFPVDNGLVTELEQYTIIYRSSNIGNLRYGVAYNIQPWAWTYLNKHNDLLEENK